MKLKNMGLLLALARSGRNCGEVASKSGVSSETISALLNRRRLPKVATANRLAAALGVPVADLFTDFASGVVRPKVEGQQ